VGTGQRPIVVAVLDTGIVYDHPDVQSSGNVLPGSSFSRTDPDTAQKIDAWHSYGTDPGVPR
jgi:hypothetical protein